MRFRYQRVETLPRLAWCATLRSGIDEVLVRHGPWVESLPGLVFEGAWDASLAEGRPDEAAVMVGTSGRVKGSGLVFATATNPYTRLFVTRGDGVLRVSNSLTFLLAEAGDEPDPRHPYYTEDLFALALAGVRHPHTELRTRCGSFWTVECGNLVVEPDLTARRVEKPSPEAPDDYAGFRDLLSETIARVFANAADERRDRRYSPLATTSRGYDSPAVTALASQHGCRESASFFESEPGSSDDGAEIAEGLGMTVHRVPRRVLPEGRELGEAEFVACPPAASVTYAGFEEFLPGRLLLRGEGGDRLLTLDRSMFTEDLSCTMGWPVWSATEFRLRVGYLDFTPLMSGWQHRDIHYRIASSAEMAPWSTGSAYERPMCRRLAEDAGVPREAFGLKKLGTAYKWIVRSDDLSPDGLSDYESFVQALDLPPSFFRGVRFRHKLSSLGRRWNRSILPGSSLRLGRTCRNPLRTGFLFHWGQARIRDRYRIAGSG